MYFEENKSKPVNLSVRFYSIWSGAYVPVASACKSVSLIVRDDMFLSKFKSKHSLKTIHLSHKRSKSDSTIPSSWNSLNTPTVYSVTVDWGLNFSWEGYIYIYTSDFAARVRHSTCNLSLQSDWDTVLDKTTIWQFSILVSGGVWRGLAD